MISIKTALQEIIQTTPYIEEALSKDLMNLSALARFVRPSIKKKLYKTGVSDAALIMALKRLQPEIVKKNSAPRIFKNMEDITVRSDLVELTMTSSPETEKIRRELMRLISEEKSFFNFIQGVKESTILLHKSLELKIVKHLTSKPLARIEGLSSITFSLPPSNRATPGVYYTILKALAWENINLTEIMSNHNEITLVFADKDVDRAFSLIKGLQKL